ncbi:signal transduction histidine kinase [Actinomadura rubrobrunea]|uniref:histidine kinase n=2 Tax=Actinomadura rubrobrunea TaxID=115335 RepID=A0A9W6UUN9_9ACTN|nr:signal transduction histidine kinase [Actinomadura rubrobrunea]
MLVCGAIFAGAVGAFRLRERPRSRRGVGPADEATFATLHTISRASPSLRAGLNRDSARKAARHLRQLLGVEAVALVAAGRGDEDDAADGASEEGPGRLLVWDGAGGSRHAGAVLRHARPVLESGRPRVIGPDVLSCEDAACRIRVAMVAPLSVEGRVEGVLAAYGGSASAARVRAVGEVARWVSSQLELAELDSSRARLAEAEMRALRAQISPHFVYNSLTTIASFVRTDPERARDLLLDFADFARYSFRNPRDFTTLADELRSIDRYLLLERARFGDRLQFSVEVAPEVLSVALPFLSLQPLVENAIRHGMAGARDAFHIKIVARDAGAEAAISVEDDGVGMDPDRLREILAAGPTSAGRDRRGGGAGIGLANVDERLRQVYGDEYGLTVETAIGAGTKVNLRVPKYSPGVFPD